MSETMKVGTIGWSDLTVPNASEVLDFYKKVVGWESSEVDMGGYSDFNVEASGGDGPIAGICHARGVNAEIPPVWMNYIVVDDFDGAVSRCSELGGSIVAGPRGERGEGRTVVIKDPAGAVISLFEPANS